MILAWLVYWDADNQGDKGAGGWAIGVILFAMIVLPLYVIFRLLGRIGRECDKCYKKIPKNAVVCSHCGAPIIRIGGSQEIPSRHPTISAKPAKPISVGKTPPRKLRRKTSSLVILVVVCVVPLVGLAYYLVTPSVPVPYSSQKLIVATITYSIYSTASVGTSTTTYVTEVESSLCLLYNQYNQCVLAPYPPFLVSVRTTSTVPIYETATMQTSDTVSNTIPISRLSTVPPYTVPEMGTYTAIVAVAAIIIGALAFYVIVFQAPRTERRPPSEASGSKSPKVTLPGGLGTKFCSECGAKIPRDSAFCEECGKSLVE